MTKDAPMPPQLNYHAGGRGDGPVDPTHLAIPVEIGDKPTPATAG